MVGMGWGVAVPVGGGGALGVKVVEGVTVGPRGIGKGRPLQAVSAKAIRSPKIVRMCFMEVLILSK